MKDEIKKSKSWIILSIFDWRFEWAPEKWKLTRYFAFGKGRSEAFKKADQKVLWYIIRCVFISSFQWWKPQSSILPLPKFFKKHLPAFFLKWRLVQLISESILNTLAQQRKIDGIHLLLPTITWPIFVW